MNRLFFSLLLTLATALVGCGDDTTTDECDTDCTTPPAAVCDADVLVSYAAEGSCISESCRYEAERTECVAGCEESEAGAICTPAP